jgi:hypothetical protein
MTVTSAKREDCLVLQNTSLVEQAALYIGTTI